MRLLRGLNLKAAREVVVNYYDGYSEMLRPGELRDLHSDGEALYIFNGKSMKIINLRWVESVVIDFKEER